VHILRVRARVARPILIGMTLTAATSPGRMSRRDQSEPGVDAETSYTCRPQTRDLHNLQSAREAMTRSHCAAPYAALGQQVIAVRDLEEVAASTPLARRALPFTSGDASRAVDGWKRPGQRTPEKPASRRPGACPANGPRREAPM
jgi:hypothetical protein